MAQPPTQRHLAIAARGQLFERPLTNPDRRSRRRRQLGLLLEAAKNMVDEEFHRTERLENKSRNAFSACGALFAVVML